MFCFLNSSNFGRTKSSKDSTRNVSLSDVLSLQLNVKLQSNPSSSSSPPLSPSPPFRDGEILSNLSVTIARARSGLIQELVEVFNVVEVGGRPPIGGKAGTKGEWTIGDLILPVPGDMRRNNSFLLNVG